MKNTSIVCYSNVELHKFLILKNNRNKSGIYRWTNKTTGKSYIGSAVNLANRLNYYFSPKSLTNSLLVKRSYIYSSILEYGYSEFLLEILEYCEIEVLLLREQYYLDTLNPEYNIRKKVGIKNR